MQHEVGIDNMVGKLKELSTDVLPEIYYSVETVNTWC